MGGFEQYVQWLVKHGCDVNIQNSGTKCSAAHVAALHFAEHPKTMLAFLSFSYSKDLTSIC